MNPYLENPAWWRGVHNALITLLQLDLAPRVQPRYYVSIEERVYITEPDEEELVGLPDIAVIGRPEAELEEEGAYPESSAIRVLVPLPDEVSDTYLEVREAGKDYAITVIEILSPTNKRPGRGRERYLEKRMEVLATRTNLVEIDLLRAWEPMPVIGNGRVSDYRILVSRGKRTPKASLYIFGVRQPIPTFPLPLRPGDQEPLVELGRLLHELYDQARYDLRMDYTKEPEPSLKPADSAWADELLRQKGLR
jgi:hypothetical protein